MINYTNEDVNYVLNHLWNKIHNNGEFNLNLTTEDFRLQREKFIILVRERRIELLK